MPVAKWELDTPLTWDIGTVMVPVPVDLTHVLLMKDAHELDRSDCEPAVDGYRKFWFAFGYYIGVTFVQPVGVPGPGGADPIEIAGEEYNEFQEAAVEAGCPEEWTTVVYSYCAAMGWIPPGREIPPLV